MKKIVLVALMALCGVSFGFGESFTDCMGDCMEVKQNRSECVGDCATKESAEARPEEHVIPHDSMVTPDPDYDKLQTSQSQRYPR